MLLSLIISPIILFIVFCIAFVLFGFIIRLFKGDLLKTKFDKSIKTYWEKRKFEVQSMKNQF